MKKLAIVTTHPIQYYAPIFRMLAQRGRIGVKVFYTGGETPGGLNDPGFGQKVAWDIPLLEGYECQWVENTADRPGSHHYQGIINPDLIRHISDWGPDALLVFGWAYRSHLKAMRHFKGKVPILFRGDSTLLNDRGVIGPLLRTLVLRSVYRYVDHAFYVGQHNKAYYLRYGLAESELSFAPHAIDNERFSVDQAAEALELRRSVGLTETDILVLYAGKFEAVKDLMTLLIAFDRLGRNGVHLLLAGSGPELSTLSGFAADSRMSHAIHFTGFRNQRAMPVLYQAADLFCLPSKSETWGLSVNEAMACGRAVLTSDKVGCAADLVRPGRNGSVFRSGDTESLRCALAELTLDKQALKAMGGVSGEIIKDWSFLRIARAIEQKMNDETDR